MRVCDFFLFNFVCLGINAEYEHQQLDICQQNDSIFDFSLFAHWGSSA